MERLALVDRGLLVSFFFPFDRCRDFPAFFFSVALLVALAGASAGWAVPGNFFFREALDWVVEPLTVFFAKGLTLARPAFKVCISFCNFLVCFETEARMRPSRCWREAGGSMSISIMAASVALLSKCSIDSFFRARSIELVSLWRR